MVQLTQHRRPNASRISSTEPGSRTSGQACGSIRATSTSAITSRRARSSGSCAMTSTTSSSTTTPSASRTPPSDRFGQQRTKEPQTPFRPVDNPRTGSSGRPKESNRRSSDAWPSPRTPTATSLPNRLPEKNNNAAPCPTSSETGARRAGAAGPAPRRPGPLIRGRREPLIAVERRPQCPPTSYADRCDG
jgi:hypothetical protein